MVTVPLVDADGAMLFDTAWLPGGWLDDQDGTRQSPCNPNLRPPDNPNDGSPMRWSFNFDNGFQGTDETTKQFYVLVYFPAPSQ